MLKGLIHNSTLETCIYLHLTLDQKILHNYVIIKKLEVDNLYMYFLNTFASHHTVPDFAVFSVAFDALVL